MAKRAFHGVFSVNFEAIIVPRDKHAATPSVGERYLDQVSREEEMTVFIPDRRLIVQTN